MTVPGVGAVVSLTYRAGVDDPARCAKSTSVGAFFGFDLDAQALPIRRHGRHWGDHGEWATQACERPCIDVLQRAAVTGNQVQRTLKRWAMDAVAKRQGHAERRKWRWRGKLATVLHRIWVDGTQFVWGKDPAAMAAT